jgi:hypothetical protein
VKRLDPKFNLDDILKNSKEEAEKIYKGLAEGRKDMPAEQKQKQVRGEKEEEKRRERDNP